MFIWTLCLSPPPQHHRSVFSLFRRLLFCQIMLLMTSVLSWMQAVCLFYHQPTGSTAIEHQRKPEAGGFVDVIVSPFLRPAGETGGGGGGESEQRCWGSGRTQKLLPSPPWPGQRESWKGWDCCSDLHVRANSSAVILFFFFLFNCHHFVLTYTGEKQLLEQEKISNMVRSSSVNSSMTGVIIGLSIYKKSVSEL